MRGDQPHAQQPLPQPKPAPTFDSKGQLGSAWNNLATLVAPPLARISVMTWALWLSITFSYYSFFTWIPTLLVQSGMTITRSFAYSISIYAAMIPGYYSAAYFNDHRPSRDHRVVPYPGRCGSHRARQGCL
jgi:putative MFS transporter